MTCPSLDFPSALTTAEDIGLFLSYTLSPYSPGPETSSGNKTVKFMKQINWDSWALQISF